MISLHQVKGGSLCRFGQMTDVVDKSIFAVCEGAADDLKDGNYDSVQNTNMIAKKCFGVILYTVCSKNMYILYVCVVIITKTTTLYPTCSQDVLYRGLFSN